MLKRASTTAFGCSSRLDHDDDEDDLGCGKITLSRRRSSGKIKSSTLGFFMDKEAEYLRNSSTQDDGDIRETRVEFAADCDSIGDIPIGLAQRGRGRRLFTLQRDGLVYDQSALWPLTAPNSACTSVSSSQSRSQSDTPSTRAWSCTPSCPSRTDGSRRLPPCQNSARAPTRPSGAPRGLRPRHRGHGTPAWSLRYCEFMGSAADDCSIHKRTASGQQTALKPAGTAVSRPVSRAGNVDAGMPEPDSVFLASKGRDKRLTKFLDAFSGVMPKHIDRLKERRMAITAFGQSKLQAGLAVKLMTNKHPEHMRNLYRACEMKGGGLLKVDNSKELSSKEVEELSQKMGMAESEIQGLYTIFNNYDFDDSGTLDADEVRNVIADLGLQPRTREEKKEVKEIWNDCDDEQVDFEGFLQLVDSIREKLRELQCVECLHHFEAADTDGTNSMELDEIWDLFEHGLGLMPRSEDEKFEIVSLFQQSDGDSDGSLNFEEFQVFVQRVRAKLFMLRREHEMTIAKSFRLNVALVTDFRADLPMLWDCFNRYDRSHRGFIEKPDLSAFLVEIGAAPQCASNAHGQVLDWTLDCMARPQNDFPTVLQIIREVRRKCMENTELELLSKFRFYDRDHSGTLSKTEIYQILEDFGMLPKSREEQQEIAVVIDRLDLDGSGLFEFSEFQDFFQRLTEQVRLSERDRERKAIVGLGFSEDQLTFLRQLFLLLKPNEDGKVGQTAVVQSFPRVRLQLDLGNVNEQRMREYIKSLSHSMDEGVNFAEFVRKMKCALIDTLEENLDPDKASVRRETNPGTPQHSRLDARAATRELNCNGPGGRGSQCGGRKGTLEL